MIKRVPKGLVSQAVTMYFITIYQLYYMFFLIKKAKAALILM